MSELEEPPLGLTPRYIAEDMRAVEITEAMDRYIRVAKPIPIEWVEEYNELCEKREKRKPHGKKVTS